MLDRSSLVIFLT